MGFLDDTTIMGSFDDFMGGGSETQMYDPYAGDQRDFFNNWTNMVNDQIGRGVDPYTGQMTAGYSPLQQQGFNQAGQYGNMVGQGQNLAQGIMGGISPQMAGQAQQYGMQGLQNVMAPFNPAIAGQGLQAGVQQAMSQTGDIRRALLEPYAGAGAADSGAAIRSLQRAGENVSMGLGTDYMNKLFSGEQNALNRQLSGIGMSQGMAQLPSQLGMGAMGMAGNSLNQYLGMGAQQRGINQEMLNEPYQKWQMSQPWNNPYLQNFGQQAMQIPGQTVVNEQQGPGLGSQLLGAGMGAAGSFLGTEAGAAAVLGFI